MQLPKLIKKKECYRLSWFSILILSFTLLLSLYFLRSNLYDYLSPIAPVETKVMVLEGWLDDFAIEEAYAIYQKQKYDLIITTGGPFDIGYLATHYITTADLAKITLLQLGMDSTKIFVVARKHILKDRTYQSAIALKAWLAKEKPDINKFNLVSLGTHSKRSHYLFKKALPEKEIGIIALKDQRFDSDKWWKTSKGSRTVITEALGYFYISFFL